MLLGHPFDTSLCKLQQDEKGGRVSAWVWHLQAHLCPAAAQSNSDSGNNQGNESNVYDDDDGYDDKIMMIMGVGIRGWSEYWPTD